MVEFLALGLYYFVDFAWPL